MPSFPLAVLAARALLLLLVLAGPRAAQGSLAPARLERIRCEALTRVADPKLAGGEVRCTFSLPRTGTRAVVRAEVLAAGVTVASPWSGVLLGGAPATQLVWDGRDEQGLRCPPGSYTLRVSGSGALPLELPFALVRLGVTSLEAQDSPAGDDEFQMVYFRKGAGYEFYATPAIGEYASRAASGQVSDLDLDDGEPRPPVAVHTDTAEPVLESGSFATAAHNYPLAYVMGARPRLELTFGASATSAQGTPLGVGYPLPGIELRVRCDQGTGVAGSDAVTPDGTALLDLEPLPVEVGRSDLEVTLRFEARAAGETEWSAIPGTLEIPLRIYTLLGPPRFKSGASGTQYAGPWVEVAEHVASWKASLGLACVDQQSLTEVFVKGFFGQNGGIPAALEGVVYDAYPLGGDGGATHYFSFTTSNMNLSRLLHHHDLGRFVNCTDNMGAATTMLSMLGAQGMRPVRLGNMTLRAIWGIGAPGYTLDLWGGSHSFSYHHIVTDDGALTVSDTCMQLDEDGNPLALPGTPGWNVRRPWAGAGGYKDLAASNNVTKTLEALPGLR